MQVPSRGPPAYNAKPFADGVGPVHRAVDGPLAISDRQRGWQTPDAVRHDVNGPFGPSRPSFHGPVAHRQMDGVMAHRGLVICQF